MKSGHLPWARGDPVLSTCAPQVFLSLHLVPPQITHVSPSCTQAPTPASPPWSHRLTDSGGVTAGPATTELSVLTRVSEGIPQSRWEDTQLGLAKQHSQGQGAQVSGKDAERQMPNKLEAHPPNFTTRGRVGDKRASGFSQPRSLGQVQRDGLRTAQGSNTAHHLSPTTPSPSGGCCQPRPEQTWVLTRRQTPPGPH